MLTRLLIIFITIPIIEIYLLFAVGGHIGIFPTLALIVLTAVIGTTMLRSQSVATLQKFKTQFEQGIMPQQALLEGLMILVGGLLLLTPGFFTDAIGFICLLPWTRQRLAAYFSRYIQMRTPQHPHTHSPHSPPHSTIEGEYKRSDD